MMEMLSPDEFFTRFGTPDTWEPMKPTLPTEEAKMGIEEFKRGGPPIPAPSHEEIEKLRQPPTPPEQEAEVDALEIVDGVLYSISEGTGSQVTREELLTIRRALRARLSSEREPDGWITSQDVARVRDPIAANVPSVNIWALQDDGDIPVYIGHPPETHWIIEKKMEDGRWAKMGGQWSEGPPELPGAKWRARPTDPPPEKGEP